MKLGTNKARESASDSPLFPALLRYWREKRGLSQLELSLEADVSARHLSFLESNRARPSEEMVLRLFAVLAVPLREQDEALRAAGFPARFEASSPGAAAIPPEIDRALDQMLEQHEPYPSSVIAIDGAILRANQGATRLFDVLLNDRAIAADPPAPNIYDAFFDPSLLRPFLLDWEDFARALVSRIHRERLVRGDARLARVLERLLAFPGVPSAWRQPDLSRPVAPTLQMGFQRGDLRVRFLVTATTFYAPQQVALDELRIESCFPLDEETRLACKKLCGRS